jgi:acetyltransferase-like isoleucine patch superfamily enzyme
MVEETSMNENANPYAERYSDALDGIGPIHPNTVFGSNVSLGRNVIIEEGCFIGNNSFIGHGCILRPNVIMGDDCKIGHLTVFEGDCTIGNRVLIHAQCHITKGVIIADDVFIAPFFCGANTKRIVHGREYPLTIDGFIIRRAARIGIGVLLLPGVTIGENAMVGAGSLVTKDVGDGEIWLGHPAKMVGMVPKDELL